MSHELTLWILFALFGVAFVLSQVIFLQREREREKAKRPRWAVGVVPAGGPDEAPKVILFRRLPEGMQLVDMGE